MSDLTDLYQEVILDHNRSPRNFGVLEGADRVADGHNPLCGDRLRLYVKLDGDRIERVMFEGSGCAISKASASLLTEAVSGLTIDEARHVFEEFQKLVTGAREADLDDELLGKLAVLGGVREFPVRVKCASLAWHTLKTALAGSKDVVKTE